MVDFSKHLKKEQTVAKPKTQALAQWDEELARAAEEAAEQEANTGGGQFFSTKSGVLSLNKAPIPGNEMVVIIVDSILENVFYEGKYDADSPQSPDCYSFGRNDETMVPHADAPNKQAEACTGCPKNEWASADTGRGKACRNRRRLALISGGTMVKGEFEAYTDVVEYEKGQIAFLPIPPTSITSYAAYVKQLAGALKRPPHAVFTRISLVPDAKSQFKVVFENMGPVPNEAIGALITRNKEAKANIEFPYPKAREQPAAPAKGKSAKRSKF